LFFLKGSPRAQFLKAVGSQALQVAALEADDRLRICKLEDKYRDQQADYTDLALIVIAERLNISEILTLDRTDFAGYRIHGRSRFDVLDWQ
jgi:uncharacterized protein